MKISGIKTNKKLTGITRKNAIVKYPDIRYIVEYLDYQIPISYPYSAKGTKGKYRHASSRARLKICEQQSEIEKRHLPAISIYGYAWAVDRFKR